MMNVTTNSQFRHLVSIIIMLVILPTLVLGDVHFGHEGNHEQVEQTIPWHAHGTCDSELENDHPDLDSNIQKSNYRTSSDLQKLEIHEPIHDHAECLHSTEISKNAGLPDLDILTCLNTLLI